MQDPNTLRWQLLELRITLMFLEAKFDLNLMVEEIRRKLQIESDDTSIESFCDEMSSLMHRIDRTGDAIRYTEAVHWRMTTPLHDQLSELFPSHSLRDVGIATVRNLIAERQFFEFADYCTFNPEGIARSELSERVNHAERLMFSALARLQDDEVQSILSAYQETDHDGSRFPVAMLEDVRNRASALA